MRVAPKINLSETVREELDRLARGRTTTVRLAIRAKMVLMAAEGKQDQQIGEELTVARQTVARWRQRFIASGIAGIEKDAPRPGRKPKVSARRVQKVVRMTTQDKPSDATHWSTRSMARAVGLSASSIRRIWSRHGLKPHLSRTFKVSNDPLFAEKVEDIVGLYLNPPEHALVLSLDEKSQVQALDRTQPGLPLKKGRAGTMTHDYKRNGTTTLFAALNVLDGKVIGTCMPRHRHQEWLKFLSLIDKQAPDDKEIHIIVDNYSAHKHPAVQRWMQKHPLFHVHYTPTSASWLNMVERFFRDLTQKRLRRGVFRSVDELITSIEDYLEHYNSHPKPFVWTAKATDILEKVKRARAKLHTLSSV
jgi:transposase